ncbi:GntR family transcriptional regulator [Actinomadura alba]|uniref:GntR family transcriptional regulator n=1 Tax=Actinomadura alba TaxID=406431 RepID=A0ABR7LNS5_9ACTN|nr:GntR family transcriptional regulator [Actinomadura alba]MBC6466504.1 GntR family transcriptional regulator [Actinomadura alba]
MPSAARPDPPYLQIAAEIRGKIRDGELRPGERVPSIRQIAQRWGVAVATATRVVTTLQEEGLVEAKVGSGTVVSARPGRRRPAGPATGQVARRPKRQDDAAKCTLNRESMLRTAIAIADVEGLDAVSMRRVAAGLGVGPMSLYRHVSNKDELVMQMADVVFGEPELPVPGPAGWRDKLELISREQWALCWRHPWLPRAVSFTRPLFVPNMLAHTEWTLRALDGLGLSRAARMQEALTLHSLVVTLGLSMADEVEAEQETGTTLARWYAQQRARTDELFAGGRFPLLAELHEDTVPDLDGLFEYSLARHLDGFAILVGERVPAPQDANSA